MKSKHSLGMVSSILFILALDFLSWKICSLSHVAYVRPGMVMLDANSTAVKLFYAVIVALTILASLSIHHARQQSIDRSRARSQKEKAERDRRSDDDSQRMKWRGRVVGFLMENRGKEFTGEQLVIELGATGEQASFLRDESGYQNGLPFYIKGMPGIAIETNQEELTTYCME